MSQKLVILRADLLLFAPGRSMSASEREDLRRTSERFNVHIIGIDGPVEITDLRDEKVLVDRIAAIAAELPA